MFGIITRTDGRQCPGNVHRLKKTGLDYSSTRKKHGAHLKCIKTVCHQFVFGMVEILRF